MALEEKISKHLGVKFVELDIKGKKYYLCENGVIFADAEYMNYADLNVEYERRAKEDKLYDYAYAKSTGLVRKKRTTTVQSKSNEGSAPQKQEVLSETNSSSSNKDISRRNEGNNGNEAIQGRVPCTSGMDKGAEKQTGDYPGRRLNNSLNRPGKSEGFSILAIVILLGFTSAISMYISTLHTATYLFDYVDIFSAWLMSASVTAYNSTAFEVSVLFKQRKRYVLAFVFITLWVMVTVFSMATTVSVFYDRFNFTESQIAEENKEVDSNKLALQLLQKKETDLREAIDFKKKDIEYRQEREYATTAVRNELVKLEEQLQENLSEQQKLLSSTPEVVETVTKRKESLFSFLGRLMHLEGGILEFIMSTLSAIFVNLIAPFSLTAVTELRKKEKVDKTN